MTSDQLDTRPLPIPPGWPRDGGPTPRVERRRRWRTPVLAATTVTAVALGAGTAGAELALHRYVPPATSSAVQAGGVTTNGATTNGTIGSSGASRSLAAVAAAVQPSVVSIAVQGSGGSGEGSGVILRPDGTILTNNHVAEAGIGGRTTVKFSDGRTAQADLVGRDPGTDLAVLKARGVSGLTPARLGSSSSVQVGDTVLAVGSPLGLDGSVSAGIVSALHRQVGLGTGSSSLGDAVQTDAPINPGNSGGPLVDTDGRVIGINTAIATLGGGGSAGQSGSIGLGFAIPVDEAAKVADALISGKKPTHALLGVQSSDAPSGGAVLGSVTPSSGAADAGLRSGDVITGVGNVRIADAAGLSSAIRSHQPGDRVEIRYLRDGETRTTTATLGSGA